ncbi:16S rRNA G1207 methylase RsmC [Allocatelliglobosispora scoriae]|uniref:16S rRNA G1207 methylase RsmC n=1 Tax=Allocatelliglobosispora scoriae TaxID=643052 RepID=A0A841BSX8_9ACTN|nr:methyltransferase [Allocatelliglobosispora scoriae]MBB5870498.1 16S rRNA G1207 methylase RsmC [Allocatelliglobosispora scoriae]
MTAEHFFTETPTTPARPREVEFSVAGVDFALTSSTGVFSGARLDPGTAVLLRKADLPGPATSGDLLDLGCGYGPITAVLATVAPKARIVAIDVNSRARELTEANALRLGIADRVLVAAPDDVPDELTFTQIWSNPPIHIGKPELHALLDRWLPRLAPDGVAWLVVAKNLGGDSLQQWLIGRGYDVERTASQKGFRILRLTLTAA